MTSKEVPKGLQLRGDLQLKVAQRVLANYNPESQALKLVAHWRSAAPKLPDDPRRGQYGTAIHVHDPELKQELMDSLEQELTRTDLTVEERIEAEELLYIQRNGQRGLN